MLKRFAIFLVISAVGISVKAQGPLDDDGNQFSLSSGYYFNSLLKLDDKMGLYAGINLSYNKWFSPDGYFEKGQSSSTFAIGAQIGYRYYFGKFAAFVEGVGTTDYAGAKIGVSIMFK